jgi:hypothetical protein
MAFLITWRPRDDQGTEDLDELERRTHKHPTQADGNRRYCIDDADLDAFTSMLDQIDAGWGDHLQTWYQRDFRSSRRRRAQ